MAVSLLGSSDARLDYGDLAAFAGLSSLTVAMTVRVTGTPASGNRMFQQWGNSWPLERSWLLNVDSTDELGFTIANNNIFYGKITTDVNLTNGSLYRIVAKVAAASNLGAIWVNGVSRTVATYVDVNTTSTTANSPNPVEIGRGLDEGVDGLDADYSEVAAWNEYVPDWFCEAYGKGYSPAFYKRNMIFYAPLLNTSHLRDALGVAGTNSSGTDAAHPSMIYPPSASYPAEVS